MSERPRGLVFVAASLDGYVAREDGAIDWLIDANRAVPKGEDCGFASFLAGIDALVMGRASFDLVHGFAEWPYGELPVVVMSRSWGNLPPGTRPQVRLTAESPDELAARLFREGRRRLYVDGGATVQSFLAAGLIDEITVTWIPILLGSGRPLFGALAGDLHLELLESRAYDFGFVQSRYRVRAGR